MFLMGITLPYVLVVVGSFQLAFHVLIEVIRRVMISSTSPESL